MNSDPLEIFAADAQTVPKKSTLAARGQNGLNRWRRGSVAGAFDGDWSCDDQPPSFCPLTCACGQLNVVIWCSSSSGLLAVAHSGVTIVALGWEMGGCAEKRETRLLERARGAAGKKKTGFGLRIGPDRKGQGELFGGHWQQPFVGGSARCLLPPRKKAAESF